MNHSELIIQNDLFKTNDFNKISKLSIKNQVQHANSIAFTK